MVTPQAAVQLLQSLAKRPDFRAFEGLSASFLTLVTFGIGYVASLLTSTPEKTVA
jgi:hypothetical protein